MTMIIPYKSLNTLWYVPQDLYYWLYGCNFSIPSQALDIFIEDNPNYGFYVCFLSPPSSSFLSELDPLELFRTFLLLLWRSRLDGKYHAAQLLKSGWNSIPANFVQTFPKYVSVTSSWCWVTECCELQWFEARMQRSYDFISMRHLCNIKLT